MLVELLVDRRPHSLRRTRHARHFLLAGLALVAALVVTACGGGSSPKGTSVPPLHAGRVGPQSMFTLGGGLTTDPSATVRTLAQLGVQSVHVYVNWSSIAPAPMSFHKPSFNATDPNAYPAAGWAPYDNMIRSLAAHHMAVNLSLTGQPPHWAEGPGDPKKTRITEPQWKPNVAEYKQWVVAVGRRYSGTFKPPGASSPLPRIDFWSGWNEPNIGSSLAPETTHSGSQVEVAPRVYRNLLDAFWSALHATGHGHDRILIGELAPIGQTTGGQPGLFSSMVPFRFLRALYCVDTDNKPLSGAPAQARGCPATAAASKKFEQENPALFNASAFALHPYSLTSLPPDQPLPDGSQDAELAALPKAISLIDRLQDVYGSHTRFPIWVTEYGYITNPPNNQYTVSPKQAALFLNWAQYIMWSDPRVKSYDQYLLNDPPTHNPFATGLRTVSGKNKPSFAAFRMPLYLPVAKASANTPLLVWGQVRPAPAARRASGKAQVATMQFQDKGSQTFKAIGQVRITNPNGYFEVTHKFTSSGALRIKWSYPHGQAVFSRAAPVTVN